MDNDAIDRGIEILKREIDGSRRYGGGKGVYLIVMDILEAMKEPEMTDDELTECIDVIKVTLKESEPEAKDESGATGVTIEGHHDDYDKTTRSNLVVSSVSC